MEPTTTAINFGSGSNSEDPWSLLMSDSVAAAASVAGHPLPTAAASAAAVGGLPIIDKSLWEVLLDLTEPGATATGSISVTGACTVSSHAINTRRLSLLGSGIGGGVGAGFALDVVPTNSAPASAPPMALAAAQEPGKVLRNRGEASMSLQQVPRLRSEPSSSMSDMSSTQPANGKGIQETKTPFIRSSPTVDIGSFEASLPKCPSPSVATKRERRTSTSLDDFVHRISSPLLRTVSPAEVVEKDNSCRGGSSSSSASSSTEQSGKVNHRIASSSLLHRACRYRAKELKLIKAALRRDPVAIGRRVELGKLFRRRRRRGATSCAAAAGAAAGARRAGSSPLPLRTGLTRLEYGLPINVALSNGASDEVVELLVDAGPEQLKRSDGPNRECALQVAIKEGSCSQETLNMMLLACPEAAVEHRDRHQNTALHTACLYRPSSVELVRHLCLVCPAAVHQKNFHGSTPLQILQRCSSADGRGRVLEVLNQFSE